MLSVLGDDSSAVHKKKRDRAVHCLLKPKRQYVITSQLYDTAKMWTNTPLSGIKVLEFAGLAPAPYAGSERLA